MGMKEGETGRRWEKDARTREREIGGGKYSEVDGKALALTLWWGSKPTSFTFPFTPG